ncbi:MAG: hypothetical protein K9M55_04690 [Candidatus Marinimicrobia bacterium]|nr:hypothetical protein [Candidatus Neomarinimicrobiota bacterium]MCF7921979.1 hypothetical protein [Candidatus Neomarinimicrobiota bacterium]
MYFLTLMSALCLITVLADYPSLPLDQPKAIPKDRVTPIEMSLISGLHHDYESIVESTIFNILHAKMHNPDLVLPGIQQELKRISLEADSPGIREKARLAHLYLTDPESFHVQSSPDHDHPERIFADIEAQLTINSYSSLESQEILPVCAMK